MAFQNNSGDIILDIVLTDEGRRRLAAGDNTFQITQFALGDDEINYELFDKTSTTALQDLSILQTPILEAFTNNTSMMKSKLLSLDNANLLYLPILKLNTISEPMTAQNNFVVCIDSTTWTDTATNTKGIGHDGSGNEIDGMIYGQDTNGEGAHIVVDSGIDSTDVTSIIDGTPVETSFMIEIDNRLGSIVSKDGATVLSPSTIDDDHIAIYHVRTFNTGLQRGPNPFLSDVDQVDFTASDSSIDGPVNKRLEFKIRSSQDLIISNFLFDRIGKQDNTTYSTQHNNVKVIDSIVRVSGMSTGFSLDIPVRFAKSI